jgi:hypothetical protein
MPWNWGLTRPASWRRSHVPSLDDRFDGSSETERDHRSITASQLTRPSDRAIVFGLDDVDLLRREHHRRHWAHHRLWRGWCARAGRAVVRSGMSDRRRAYVQGVRRLRRQQPLHRWSLLCEPGRLSVLGHRRLWLIRALHSRSVLREPSRQPVLAADAMRRACTLHRRHVLRQRERIAVSGEHRLRPQLGVRQRQVQLTR